MSLEMNCMSQNYANVRFKSMTHNYDIGDGRHFCFRGEQRQNKTDENYLQKIKVIRFT